MTYVVNVPIEVESPVSEADPDVRSISRLPGFVRLEPGSHNGHARYDLTIEVEAGSVQGATDVADDLIVDIEDALGAYRPRLLAPVRPRRR